MSGCMAWAKPQVVRSWRTLTEELRDLDSPSDNSPTYFFLRPQQEKCRRLFLTKIQSAGRQKICPVLRISWFQRWRFFGQMPILAQKAIGHLVWHGHDREGLGVFLLDRADQIVNGLNA